MNVKKTCCITGTGGFLGSRLAAHFSIHGWNVIELNSSGKILAGGTAALRFELGGPTLQLPSGVHSLIHAAYDFNAVRWADVERINVQGSVGLFKAAQRSGVQKYVHVSSMSAYPSCRSLYGKAKLATELAALRLGALVLRPGLIHNGSTPGGMLGKLDALSRSLPIIPIPGDGNAIFYFSHQSDLARVAELYCRGERESPKQPVVAANPTPWSFRAILEKLAREHGRAPAFLPIPWYLIWSPLKLSELLGMVLPFKSDSLVSLLHQDPNPLFEKSWSREFRSFAN